jgi:S-adenosylmethionine:tRNA ribosyltransferase-isomerase
VSAPDLADYDYPLPPERIAQSPATPAESARLLCLARDRGAIEHGRVGDLAKRLRAGDLLVVNETRVLPARLRGTKSSGGRAEALLLGPSREPGRYRALLRARGRIREGQKLQFSGNGLGFDAEVAACCADGEFEICIDAEIDPYAAGETPLPPYIRRDAPSPADLERYQTAYARVPGSVAAPTAGLHLTTALLAALAGAGVELARVVLHVGPGTFRPPRAGDLARGELHAEPFELSPETALAIDAARARGARVVAVGTTTTRVLESCAIGEGRVRAARGETRLLLAPGSAFRVVDALLTNFHLPRSSLLLLVSAFAGRERVLAAYAEAIARGYRFYSYGDAMLIE